MTSIESLDLTEYSDDDLRQQYSLTFKIRTYYELCLEKESGKTKGTYTLLLKQANIDLDDVKKELLARKCTIPEVSMEMEHVAAEKNEEEPPADEDITTDGQVSYETPVIVHKLDTST